MESITLRRLNTVSAFLLLIAFIFSVFAVPFMVLFILSILMMVFSWFSKTTMPTIKLEIHDYCLGLFFVSVLISAAFAEYNQAGFEGGLVILAYLLVYFFFKISNYRKDFYRRLVFAAAAGLIISCSFALMHYFLIKHDIIIKAGDQIIWAIMATNPSLSGLPLISILEHPAVGGNLLAFVSIIVLSLLANENKVLKPAQIIMLSAAFLLALITIILTQTRGSILILTAAVVVQAFFTRKYIILLGLVILGGLMLALPNEKLRNTLMNPLSSPNMPGRFLQYEAGFEMLSKSNPVFGIGLLNFRPSFKKDYSERPYFEEVPYIHNNFEALLVETGVLGFLLFYGFIGLVVFRTGKEYLTSERTTPRLTALSLTAGFLLNSLFDSLLYVVPIGILLWITLGFAFNKSVNEKN